MDYDNERRNIDLFGRLYAPGRPAARALARSARSRRGGRGAAFATAGEILLPTALPRWSGGRCLAMSWVEGAPLLGRGQATLPPTELPLVRFGIEATLSQSMRAARLQTRVCSPSRC